MPRSVVVNRWSQLLVPVLAAVFTVLGVAPAAQAGGYRSHGQANSQRRAVLAATDTALLPGFNQYTLAGNDDGSTGAVPLPFALSFYGHTYSQLYVNNNGNLTFGASDSNYTPQSLNQIGLPMIAPFWADVDTRNSPPVRYGYGTVNGHPAFAANWLGVGCYSEISSVANYFQVVLISRSELGYGKFDIEFNYGPIAWDSGQASGGDAQCRNGTAARAGYTSGFGSSYEIPGSGVSGAFLSGNRLTALASHDYGSNQQGRYIFPVRAAGTPTSSGYVALGDSFSSGEGTKSYDLMGAPCDRSSLGWPKVLSNNYAAAPTLTNAGYMACSGDTTDQLENGKAGEPVSQLQQLKNYVGANGAPSLVTVTVGGDDLGFASLLKGCYIVGAPECLNALDSRVARLRSGSVTDLLRNTYEKIAAAAQTSQVVAVGYPRIFPTPSFSHDLSADERCVWLDGDAGEIFSRFQSAQALLDSVMSRAASEAGIRSVMVPDALNGHELCTGDSYFNALTPAGGIGRYSGHPNQEGQVAYASAVASALGYLAGNGGGANADNRASARGKKQTKSTSADVPVKTGRPAVPRGFAARVAAATTRARPARAITNVRSDSATLSVQSSLPSTMAGVDYTGALWTTGTTDSVTWSVSSGALPDGLSLDTDTGTVSGIPTAAGARSFTVTATDTSDPTESASADLSLTVTPTSRLRITTSHLPTPTTGRYYSQTLTATGGLGGNTWSVTRGTLPTGLTLDADTGTISGTATGATPAAFTVSVSDASTPTRTASAAFALDPAASGSALSYAALPTVDGTQGTAYAGQLEATGGTGPLTWTITSGTLPNGLTLSPSGDVTGIPVQSGRYSVSVQASDQSAPAAQTTSGLLSFDIAPVPGPSANAVGLADGTVGQPYDEVVASSGGVAPLAYSVTTGALPDGLALDPAVGTISGTPAASGQFDFTVEIQDSAFPDPGVTSRNETITIADPPPPATLTVADTVGDATVNDSYAASVYATGGTGPYTYAVANGQLPNGVSLDASSGELTGTPTTTGTFAATITATDSSGPTQTAADHVTIRVNSPAQLAISTTTLPNATSGTPYATQIQATGGIDPDSFALSNGALPNGLSLDPNTGIISGTPTNPVTADIAVSVTDSDPNGHSTATANLQIIVDPPASLTIAASDLPDPIEGFRYNQTLTASGGTEPYTWSVPDDGLPRGLNLDPDTGVLAGTPDASGTFNFTVYAVDSATPSASAQQSFTLTVAPAAPLTVVTSSLTPGVQDSAYSAALRADGGTAPVSWSIQSGSLPAGLRLGTNGRIYGTPHGFGIAQFIVKATDNSHPQKQTAQQQLTLEIDSNGAPLRPQTIHFTAPPGARVGGSDTLAATGGRSGNAVTFSLDAATAAGVCALSGDGPELTYLGTGACVVDANQLGNSTYAPAPQVQATITVAKATSRTELSSSVASASYGDEQTVTLRVAVTAPGEVQPSGTVTIKAGRSTVCIRELNATGQITCTLRRSEFLPGTVKVRGLYSGSAAVHGSKSDLITLHIRKEITATALRAKPGTVRVGAEKRATFHVAVTQMFPGRPSGRITIKTGRRTLCAGKLRAGALTCRLASNVALRSGHYKLIASYTGSVTAATSHSKQLTFTVRPRKR